MVTGDSDGTAASGDQLYRISYDGSIVEERRFVVMGGVTEPVITSLHGLVRPRAGICRRPCAAAVTALGTAGEGAPRELLPTQLEVAVLDRSLRGRTFRRLQGTALAELLASVSAGDTESVPQTDDGAGALGDARRAAQPPGRRTTRPRQRVDPGGAGAPSRPGRGRPERNFAVRRITPARRPS